MMSIFLRLLLSAIFSFLFYLSFSEKNNREITKPIIEPYTLPIFMAAFFAFSVFFSGGAHIAESMMSSFFPIFFHIGIYYALLLLAMPYLRRLFPTAVTSILWIIPNYLYIMSFTGYRLDRPLFAIKLNGLWTKYVPLVWLLGFAVIFLYKIISHMLFRSRLLKNSYSVTDERILNLWDKEKDKISIKKADIPLYTSNMVSTPLSVGLFKRSVFVVLPEKNYTDEQLNLIFRHELIHIVRSDGWTKFFIMFCNAACWFNPLMWISMKRCSEDIELNCDETALIGEDDSTRRQYAQLILSSANDERGFTSCLSASAKSLKYRLENIMNPKKKKKGIVFASVVFFVLLISCQTVTFALNFGLAKDVVLSQDSKIGDRVNIYRKNESGEAYTNSYEVRDKEAFLDYIGNLRLYRLTGLYEYENASNILEFSIDDKGASSSFAVSGGHLSRTVYKEKKFYRENYIFYEDIDEDYLLSCLEKVDIASKISAPELMLCYFDGDKKLMEEPMYPGKEIISVKNGDSSGDIPHYDNISPSVISGYCLDKVKLSFSYEPSSYVVYVYPYGDKEGKSAKTYNSTELKDNLLFVNEDCSCVLDAIFVMNSTTYRIKYYFDIDLL